jgi:hypothetical protein
MLLAVRRLKNGTASGNHLALRETALLRVFDAERARWLEDEMAVRSNRFLGPDFSLAG